MNKKELIGWCKKYDRDEDLEDKMCERDLGEKLRARKELTKREFFQTFGMEIFGQSRQAQKREELSEPDG